jgi:hypothetical protein
LALVVAAKALGAHTSAANSSASVPIIADQERFKGMIPLTEPEVVQTTMAQWGDRAANFALPEPVIS